ncbi:hypothetical protein [Vibrio sp. TBV020]|uniref:hypothetical protein n=1 Tax=Vibrio sp. TBV020 TaxID=3137398 RepID=UPI0038CD8813
MPSIVKLLLVVLAVGGGFFANDIVHWFKASNSPISLDDYCMLTTQPCIEDSISISADKETSQPLVPTQVEVKWQNSSADNLIISLQGYEMDMGTVVFKLNSTGGNAYTGQVILPVCTTDAMTWYGTVSDGTTSIKTSIRMER